MKALIEQYFSIQVMDIKNLGGYDNANYLVKTASQKYIFKTYRVSDDDTKSFLEAENQVFRHLASMNTSQSIKGIDDQYVFQTEFQGVPIIIRLLSFVEGDFMGDVPQTDKLLRSFGHFLGEMDLKLCSFQNYFIQAHQHAWDNKNWRLNQHSIALIENPSQRKLVEHVFLNYEEHVVPKIPFLRQQIIHNDANEGNVLTKNGVVSGIIDFGDMAYTFLINELAIAITYAVLDQENPIKIACIIIMAYVKKNPLLEQEIDVLYYLIETRLAISVCNSAQGKIQNPENAHIFTSEKAAFVLLEHWIAINPIFAQNEFRKAAGLRTDTPQSTASIISQRHRSISPILSLSYEKPIYMKGAAFQYMYDAYGNAYLDAYNNIPHVGHLHPKVVTAGQRAMARLNTNTRYLYDDLNVYSEKLLAKFPKELSKVFFVNSGSAASDLAIRLATYFTKKKKIVVMEHGYHGHTRNGIEISDYKFNNKKGLGKQDHIIKAEIPDTYNGKYKNNDGTAGLAYANDLISQIMWSKNEIAAFISEPIVGCAGQVPLAKGYLAAIYPEIRKQGGVCISDEVQTGFGRLGDVFWGFEAQAVVPDIVVLGKPMGNGHPMGAVVCTEEIAKSFESGVEFFSSFGGNPVSMAIGLAVLDVIEEEQLQQNALEVGNYYQNELRKLQKENPCIGDIRGSGLFIGIEIIHPQNQSPNRALAHQIKNNLRNQHILISTDGPFDNVIKSKPPICFTKKDVDRVINAIMEVLGN